MLNNSKQCTGCSACENICPKHAIIMKTDEYGFLYPEIDHNICVNCGMCENVCHIKHDCHNEGYIQKAFAVLNRNSSIQNNSSSAGIFTLLATKIINLGGLVYGATWKNKYSLHHVRIDSIEQLDKLRKSKYLQSDLGNVFSQIKCDLEDDRYVLFVGTPCQVAGLKSFLKKSYEKLFLVDLVCHGVPSASFFKAFIEYEEKKRVRKITSLDFRHKIKDKASYITAIRYSRLGLKFTQYEPWFGTSYGYFFMNGYSLRDSCYACKYAQSKRTGDITLGDFWSVRDIFPELNERNGVGLLVINNSKGDSILKEICDSLDLFECDVDEAIKRNPQMYQTTVEPNDRQYFLEALKSKDFRVIDKFYKSKMDRTQILKRYRYKCSLLVFNIVHLFKRKN